MENNKILETIFIKANIKLISPISIGNAIEDNTDNDLLTDSEGKIFIPGTSIAGAVRSYLDNIYKDKEILNKYMGYSNGDKGCQSSVYFYDAEIIKEGKITIRDGIALEEFLKVTKDTAKYNYEVAERDNVFSFKLELVIRKWNEECKDEFYNITKIVIKAIQEGKILLGSKTNRGLGKVRLDNLQALKFDFNRPEALKEYLDFSWDKDFSDNETVSFYEGNKVIDINSIELNKDSLTKIQVPLKVKDTLFIRNYLLSNDDVDAEQMNFDGKFIIPGTTWSGAFKHRMFIILYDLLNGDKPTRILNDLFGEKGDNKKQLGKQSRIIFEESISNDVARFHEIRRTKIDRFTGGACDKGLFESRVAVGGNTELNIWIKDAKEHEIALVLMCIYDLLSGFLAIGGETSVGRGILSSNEELEIKKEDIKINDIYLTDEISKLYMKALKQLILR